MRFVKLALTVLMCAILPLGCAKEYTFGPGGCSNTSESQNCFCVPKDNPLGAGTCELRSECNASGTRQCSGDCKK